jgi:hypothetical protein
MKFRMLSFVWVNALKEGKPARVEGEVVAIRPPNWKSGEAYDVMLPPGCVAPHNYRGTEIGGDPRVCVDVPPGDLEFSRAAAREIDIPPHTYHACNLPTLKEKFPGIEEQANGGPSTMAYDPRMA